ncbi:MAG: ABC transporter ATP-binding protein [Acidimicrobiales bacterium]
MPAVEVTELVVRYPGGKTAVDGVSLSADAGEVVVVLGPNGAGKTSTVETLEGYRSPTAGRVRVLGLDPVAQHGRLMPRIGVMLQKGGVYPGIRAVEAVHLFASYYEEPADPDELLDRVGLTGAASTMWRRLSGGEQQRLSLALALMGRPEVVFLDEPTAGIDVAGRQLVRAIVSELRSSGTCVLVTTHELDEAERIADRVVIIDHGRVRAAGSLADLAGASGGSRSVTFDAPAGFDTTALASRLGTPVEERPPGSYRAIGPTSTEAVATVAAWLAENGLAVSNLRAGGAGLEEVFLHLTASQDRADDEADTAAER